jgi:hypothetical protein
VAIAPVERSPKEEEEVLRLETETGWWLVTHPDHARLAGAFAERWGNDRFLAPEPRAYVLKAVARHDDGWALRDATPQITRQGRPSAYSIELVGKYSAFEEIDLADYLAVRDRAVRLIAEEDPYAAILISMHTYNLLSEHADRSTIQPDELPLLDQFLAQQKAFQLRLFERISLDQALPVEQKTEATILDHFRLLQAADSLSLLACVDFSRPANLLHSLPLRGGARSRVEVRRAGSQHFVLDPYPFAEAPLTFPFPARQVTGKLFSSSAKLQEEFHAAPVETLSVTFSAA